MSDAQYILYILVHDQHNKTYCGITNNLTRRLRQHNSEIVGGARYTTNNLMSGRWSYYALVQGLTKSEALSLEWKMHHQKSNKGKTPIERRINTLKKYVIDYELV